MNTTVSNISDMIANGQEDIIEATRMGRPLYEKYGFVKMENEMELLD